MDKKQYKVVFRDNTSVTTAQLIGADGAWSKVRNILTDIKPFILVIPLLKPIYMMLIVNILKQLTK